MIFDNSDQFSIFIIWYICKKKLLSKETLCTLFVLRLLFISDERLSEFSSLVTLTSSTLSALLNPGKFDS
jgi:hypothetical protein